MKKGLVRIISKARLCAPALMSDMEGYHDAAKSFVMRRKGHRIYFMASLGIRPANF